MSSTDRDRRNQLICLWAGPLGYLLFGIGFWPVAGFVPPLLPSWGAGEISAVYRSNTGGILVGMLIIMAGVALLAACFAGFTVQVKRMAQGPSPYAMATMISSSLVLISFFVCPVFMAAAAFRPDRSAEITLLMNDLAWIALVTPAAPAIVQAVMIGCAIFAEPDKRRTIPRWAGYFCFWCAVLFIPGALACIFKTGPFAWNGLLAFWLAAWLFGGWIVVMTGVFARAVQTQSEGAA
jgi:hypothetical protein